jgi:2-polyprenyl-3-methyl-5-hydroxy-6-metoxy-1,4-benzoquinol methylase
MKKNYYTTGYKKSLLKKNIDFMEPAENFIRIFKMNFLKKKNLHCLDFGVGDGRHTKFLLKKKYKVLATDISVEAINLSKKNIKGFKNYLILKDENYEKLLSFNRFDLIVCWETIHWLGDFDKIMNLMNIFKQCLNRKGKIIITFPAEDHYLINNYNQLFKTHTYKIKQFERRDAIICAPKLNILKKVFRDNQLKILQIYKYSHGRIIFNNVKNQMKSGGIKTKSMFSMYAFLLEK